MAEVYLYLMAASGLVCGYMTLRYWYVAAKYGATYVQHEDNGALIKTSISTVVFSLACHLFITIYSTYDRLDTIAVETSLQLQAISDGCLNKGGE